MEKRSGQRIENMHTFSLWAFQIVSNEHIDSTPKKQPLAHALRFQAKPIVLGKTLITSICSRQSPKIAALQLNDASVQGFGKTEPSQIEVASWRVAHTAET